MDTFDLASALRGAVSDLHKRLRKQAYSVMGDSIGCFSITEQTTLSYLYREGSLYPSELADINKIKKQSMSQVLNHLEEAKMIRRIASKEDRRKISISLTVRGKKMVEQSRSERDEWLAGAIRKVLQEKEIRILEAAIPLLEKIVNVY
jgi:DNA-binding MarR family transcriptional regulator